MENMYQKIKETAAFLQQRGFAGAEAAVVLGTGLGAFVNLIEEQNAIPYADIPHFPAATVEFHKGQLIAGKIANKKVIAMQGRFHYYEGYNMQQITFPVRVMKELGVQYILLSNAAGGMNIEYKKGDLIVIDDHINQLPDNPLRGLNDPAFGNRFVDMCRPYDPQINNIIVNTGKDHGVVVKKGIYVSVAGPNLETRAEYRYLRSLGADMVGMSTVPEVIVANHIGLRCGAVSVITDECDPDNLQPVNISDIIETAGKADTILSKIFFDVIASI